MDDCYRIPLSQSSSSDSERMSSPIDDTPIEINGIVIEKESGSLIPPKSPKATRESIRPKKIIGRKVPPSDTQNLRVQEPLDPEVLDEHTRIKLPSDLPVKKISKSENPEKSSCQEETSDKVRQVVLTSPSKIRLSSDKLQQEGTQDIRSRKSLYQEETQGKSDIRPRKSSCKEYTEGKSDIRPKRSLYQEDPEAIRPRKSSYQEELEDTEGTHSIRPKRSLYQEGRKKYSDESRTRRTKDKKKERLSSDSDHKKHKKHKKVVEPYLRKDLSAKERAELIAEYRVRYDKVREFNPHLGVRDFSDNEDLEVIDARLKKYQQYASGCDDTETYVYIMVIMLVGLEVFCIKVLGLDMRGFSLSQLDNFAKYRKLLNEIGGSNGAYSNWSPEMKLLSCCLMNAVFFCIFNILSNHVGEQIGEQMKSCVKGVLNPGMREILDSDEEGPKSRKREKKERKNKGQAEGFGKIIAGFAGMMGQKAKGNPLGDIDIGSLIESFAGGAKKKNVRKSPEFND